MGRGHTNISFKYLDSKVSKRVCRFLDKHTITLSSLSAYLMVGTSLDGKTIKLAPSKGAKIETIIESRGSKEYLRGFFDNRIYLMPISIKMGKIEYNIYRDPREEDYLNKVLK